MEHDKQGTGMRLLRVQDLPNVRMRDALLTATRALRTRPEPRWQWDNVASNRAEPWLPMQRMLVAAIKAGAPIDDVLAPLRELEGQLRALADTTGNPAPVLMTLLVDETRADAAADIAQAEVAASPSRPALERLVATTELQESRARRLCAAARRILGTPISWRRGIA